MRIAPDLRGLARIGRTLSSKVSGDSDQKKGEADPIQQAVERGLAAASGYSEEEAESEGPVEEVIAAGFSAQNSFGQICATCHGSGGEGDGAAGAALDPAPASFIDPAFWQDRDRDRIITVIRDGAAAVGGSALMAPWGALYTDDQLEQMADYVMSFRPN